MPKRGYLEATGEWPDCTLVDERTARDLDLDEVFSGIDLTRSDAGSSYLYSMLRNQPRCAAVFTERTRLREAFASDGKARILVRKILSKLGKQGRGDLPVNLFDPGPSPFGKYGTLIRVQAGITIAIVLWAIFAFSSACMIAGMVVAVMNIAIYIKTNPLIHARAGSVFYLGSLVSTAQSLSSRVLPEPMQERAILKTLAARLRRVTRWTPLFRSSQSAGVDLLAMLIDYLRMFFLAEATAYIAAHAFLSRNAEDVRRIYETVGSIDAWSAVAELMATRDDLCLASVGENPRGIDAIVLVHPLVRGCVPNDLCLEKGAILTGANMSGKSTFLRSLGISQILATSLGFAFARSFATSMYEVMSSVGGGDDIHGGRSRYLVEAERLLEVVKAVDRGELVLALVDEILSGTNVEDRVRASISVLGRLARSRSIVVAATHDLPIARAVREAYALFRFEDTGEDGMPAFDFTLRPGLADRRNALSILRSLGYDDLLLGSDVDE